MFEREMPIEMAVKLDYKMRSIKNIVTLAPLQEEHIYETLQDLYIEAYDKGSTDSLTHAGILPKSVDENGRWLFADPLEESYGVNGEDNV